ncbi:hypothetical protein AB6A40_011100 [Gnathostoma spinigerum]|uniref:Uncharacterized protein n=1 Tax=Gnathostoma spinigerum TaxID=75299 RepID=A0ABD6EYF9_9BILA
MIFPIILSITVVSGGLQCWTGINGVINGFAGDGFKLQECNSTRTACISVKSCRIIDEVSDKYEYGIGRYCEGERFFDNPPGIAFSADCPNFKASNKCDFFFFRIQGKVKF